MSGITDPRDIILAPIVSEKSYGLLETGRYTFLVHPDANKTQIKIAIEQIFTVKVVSVNTMNRAGKRKRTRSGFGQRKVDEAGDRDAVVGQQADRNLLRRVMRGDDQSEDTSAARPAVMRSRAIKQSLRIR